MVRITNLVMGKISYGDKMWIQTLREIGSDTERLLQMLTSKNQTLNLMLYHFTKY